MCVWILASCQESKEEAMLRLVNEWNGKEIKFPSHSIFTVLGKDTVDFSFTDANYKVLTYIDSMGCTSCKLQLPRWKEWVHEVDSLTDGKVPFLFYLHPKDMKELRYLTRRDGFSYPVCYDEKDELNRLNRFPSANNTWVMNTHTLQLIAISRDTCQHENGKQKDMVS